ncbi:aminotransferase class V-fold PLP-dependent enzyme, partial [Mesorhizobium sp. M7D.F.Ca.US.004.01.2.1]|uniref:aminotransferase class V-fold PLP-dependent enzyme n=1 Tax=Mesorhizobium sp. M7D.F.Ca.US.004.01.2.1 TaxID=2496738 RepID=UPI0019CF700F
LPMDGAAVQSTPATAHRLSAGKIIRLNGLSPAAGPPNSEAMTNLEDVMNKPSTLARISHPARLDVDFCRGHFPGLSTGWTYLDNAGGSYVPESVIARMSAFLSYSKNQPYPHFESGNLAMRRIEEAYEGIARLINADRDEIVIAGSTTSNVFVLAQALRPLLQEGDEIIVSQQDHESNSGAWRKFSEFGVSVVEWQINPDTGLLDVGALRGLLTPRTKLVCFTHVSNVIGAINPVSEITALAHEAGAQVVIDGVAYAGHALVDVKAWNVDFYLFSLYKLYGPHLGVLYGKREAIQAARNQNHFFYSDSVPAKLHPTGDQYEVVGAAAGIADYIDALYAHHFNEAQQDLHERARRVFSLFEAQEDLLGRKLVEFLVSRPEIRVFGPQTGNRQVRMPTVAFTVKGWSSREFAEALAARKFAIAYGSFYSRRCLAALGMVDMEDGAARISLLHYNSMEEIEALIAAIKDVLSGR